MSLGHVYIVLEPVGSARLTFGDDRYYEFMCFDVPKVVRSPGCDHGHAEESLNGPYSGREEAGQGVARNPLAQTK